jgi:hypothetical protein
MNTKTASNPKSLETDIVIMGGGVQAWRLPLRQEKMELTRRQESNTIFFSNE